MNTKQKHKWEATGVSHYPTSHPIVGQTNAFQKIQTWLSLFTSQDFAHVLALIAPWGVGKSRLGYEIISQANENSKGWKVRDANNQLVDGELFADAERDKFFPLFIRYSQIYSESLNLDNWFSTIIYRALLPLVAGHLDQSIQHRIAKESYDRLDALGFDFELLAEVLQVENAENQDFYMDHDNLTAVCEKAFGLLKEMGIEYFLIVLDELETVAERLPQDWDTDDVQAMDGHQITLMNKAIKEEDARAKFPWLRLVALCSPAVGDGLKEVNATARRFEVFDLAQNAFSDVSAFVGDLSEKNLLSQQYPTGLVEAAYMISGTNFGWFNVLMATVDQVLQTAPKDKKDSLAWIFQRAIDIQERIGRYLLDKRALDDIDLTKDRDIVMELLFHQQPMPLEQWNPETIGWLDQLTNTNGESLTTRFHRVSWKKQEWSRLLLNNRFTREEGTPLWIAPGIPERIDVETLLRDLSTLSVHETSTDSEVNLLLPDTLQQFLQLIDLLHPHPATEEVGEIFWKHFVGTVEESAKTHIGPSVEILRRLNIRLKKSSVGTILRDPQANENLKDTLEQLNNTISMEQAKKQRLTGALRIIDNAWGYDFPDAGLNLPAITTNKKGLLDLKALSLHPKEKIVLAWVDNDNELEELATAVATKHKKIGRYPTIAFTTDYELPERFEKATGDWAMKAKETIFIVHLNSREKDVLLTTGFALSECKGFILKNFTTLFSDRMNRFRASMFEKIRSWREELSLQGGIAWPLRPNGSLKDDSFKLLCKAWQLLQLKHPNMVLSDLPGSNALFANDISIEQVQLEVSTLQHSPVASAKGYGIKDHSFWWEGKGGGVRPNVAPFLLQKIIIPLFDAQTLDRNTAQTNWFWGFLWDRNREKSIFEEWMNIAVDLKWARIVDPQAKKEQYELLPLAYFQGKWNEANNWLTDEKDENSYRVLVKRLYSIFGEKQLMSSYNLDSGTKFNKAKKDLHDARTYLDELEILESNTAQHTPEWFLKITKLRLKIHDAIYQVYDQEDFQSLNFEADNVDLVGSSDEPLWKQIGKTNEFSKWVQGTAKQIRKRIGQVGTEMSSFLALQDDSNFPTTLFRHCLNRIDSIVDKGLTGDDYSATTKRVAQAKPGSLAYYLLEFQTNEAQRKLLEYGKEVGVYGNKSSETVGFDDIEGKIITTFKELYSKYQTTKERLMRYLNQLHVIQDKLVEIPNDFRLPQNISVDAISMQLLQTDAEIQIQLTERIHEFIDDNQDLLESANFGLLMKKIREEWLEEPDTSLNQVGGLLRTIDNTIAQYQKRLLENPKIQKNLEALNSLRKLKKKTVVLPPTKDIFKDLSLQDSEVKILGLLGSWEKESQTYLKDTGVDFLEWQEVLVAIKEKKEPTLTEEQKQSLMEKGFIRRIYDLGVGEV